MRDGEENEDFVCLREERDRLVGEVEGLQGGGGGTGA